MVSMMIKLEENDYKSNSFLALIIYDDQTYDSRCSREKKH